MAYKVLDVARYIINYSNKMEYGISKDVYKRQIMHIALIQLIN